MSLEARMELSRESKLASYFNSEIKEKYIQLWEINLFCRERLKLNLGKRQTGWFSTKLITSKSGQGSY